MWKRRLAAQLLFLLALGWAQFRESGAPELAAHLSISTEPLMPVRMYLFKDRRPFRLSPVGAMLPLRVDLFYRERLWIPAPDSRWRENGKPKSTGIPPAHFSSGPRPRAASSSSERQKRSTR